MMLFKCVLMSGSKEIKKIYVDGESEFDAARKLKDSEYRCSYWTMEDADPSEVSA